MAKTFSSFSADFNTAILLKSWGVFHPKLPEIQYLSNKLFKKNHEMCK